MPFCVIIVSRIINSKKIKFKLIANQIELKIDISIYGAIHKSHRYLVKYKSIIKTPISKVSKEKPTLLSSKSNFHSLP